MSLAFVSVFAAAGLFQLHLEIMLSGILVCLGFGDSGLVVLVLVFGGYESGCHKNMWGLSPARHRDSLTPLPPKVKIRAHLGKGE